MITSLRRVPAAASLAVLATVGAATACGPQTASPASSPATLVATVGEQQVTASDIAFRMRMLAPEVANASAREGLDADAEVERLREAALESALDDAPLLDLAGEAGLIDWNDHDGFLAALERENAERAGALSRGEIVYGLTEFTPEQYYTRTLTQVRNDLIRDLADDRGGPLDVDRSDVRAHFEATADQWEAAVATYDVRTYTVPRAEQAPATCVAALIAAGEQGPASAITRRCPDVVVERVETEGESRPQMASPEGLALSSIELLDVGQATAPLPDGAAVTVYELLGKEVDPDKAFAAYRDRIRQSLLSERLDALLVERRESSRPTIHRSALENISLEDS